MGYTFRAYKPYYKRNLTIATPIIFSHMGQMFVQLADSVMVGRLGAAPLAAVSFGNAIFLVLFIFGLGFSIGITPLVGEKYVQGNHRHNAAYLHNSLILYPLMGLVICGAQLAMVPLLRYMGQPQEVITLAVPFYRWLALSIVPFMVFASFKQFLEGLGNTKVAMVIVVACNVVNIALNYLFIYGNFGFPALGAAGAGLSSFIARCCMAVAIALYFTRRDSFRRYFHFYRRANLALRHVRSLMRVGLPISVQMFLESTVFSLTTVMVGWIGVNALAAHQVAMSTISFAWMLLIGVVSATTVMVSHQAGRGDREGVRMTAHASYHMTFVYTILMGIVFVTCRNVIPFVFTSDRAVGATAAHLLLIAAGFELFDGLQFTSAGILRGLKDVIYPMWVALISYVVLSLPVAWLLAFRVGLGVNGVWLGVAVGLALAAYLLNRRYRKRMAGF